MLMILASVALLAVILVAALALWSRSRRNRPDGNESHEDAAGPATVTRVGTHADHFPQRAAPKEEFDAEATQVFMRPSPGNSLGAPRRRDAAAPIDVTGARLVGLSGSHKGRSYPIGAAGITVGRNASCDIVLGDARVSGRHAWIGVIEGKLLLRDLKSTNGTFLNAQTHVSVSETELRSGDTIFFGGHQGDQFRFVAD
jgi:hypothetical protein